jgi:carbonic anhydrase
LPENLAEFFDVFDSERQNVIRAVEFIRQSPLVGPRIPVQGLMVNVQTGELEWIVNGYEVLGRPSLAPAGSTLAK